MGITSALVLLAIVWWMTFFVVLPFKIETQGDRGEILEGTHAGSPEKHNLKRKAWITTGIAVVIWIVLVLVINSGLISVRDFDIYDFMGQPEG